MAYQPIENYGIIGNMRTCALVSGTDADCAKVDVEMTTALSVSANRVSFFMIATPSNKDPGLPGNW